MCVFVRDKMDLTIWNENISMYLRVNSFRWVEVKIGNDEM